MYATLYLHNYATDFTHLPPEQNGYHFEDDVFTEDTLNILIQISLKFVSGGPLDKKPDLV